MVANDPHGMANFDLRGMHNHQVGMIYVANVTLLQTKYIICGQCGSYAFRKDCLKFFPIILL